MFTREKAAKALRTMVEKARGDRLPYKLAWENMKNLGYDPSDVDSIPKNQRGVIRGHISREAQVKSIKIDGVRYYVLNKDYDRILKSLHNPEPVDDEPQSEVVQKPASYAEYAYYGVSNVSFELDNGTKVMYEEVPRMIIFIATN